MRQDLLEKILKIREVYIHEGFLILGIFGSYCRGEETKNSDLDILYSMTTDFSNRYEGWDIYEKIQEIQKFVEKETGLSVDLVNKDGLDAVGKYFILPEVEYVA